MSPGQAQASGQVQGQLPRKIRTFVAVPLPADLQTAILGATSRLAVGLPDIKWSRKAENLHITLKFLGQVGDAPLARFGATLAAALGTRPSFEVALRGFGAFPSVRDAQVIWVGVEDPTRRLGDVARVVEEVADQIGLGEADPKAERSDRRGFRAHVTVGRSPRRARRGADAAAALAPWAQHPFGSVSVREIHLYESITGGDASTYVLRGKAMLEGATHGDGKEREQGTN
jgi:2'-5' RNA ligase